MRFRRLGVSGSFFFTIVWGHYPRISQGPSAIQKVEITSVSKDLEKLESLHSGGRKVNSVGPVRKVWGQLSKQSAVSMTP